MAIFNKDARAADETRSPALGGSSSLSIIAAGTSVDGDIETEGVIRVEGRVEGSIHAGRQVLIGRQGEVHGDITMREAVVGGKVEGTINASERLEVQSTSIISGDINTRAIAVVEGGRINGTVRITDAKEHAESEEVEAPSLVFGR